MTFSAVSGTHSKWDLLQIRQVQCEKKVKNGHGTLPLRVPSMLRAALGQKTTLVKFLP